MHSGIQSQILRIIVIVIVYSESVTVRIRISCQCKRRKRDQIDAVALLQRCQITVSGGHADHITDAGPLSAGRPHPYHIMVTPLHIHRMILTERIQNNMRPRPPVVDISHDMKVIDNEPLDQIAQCYNKLLGSVQANDRMDDFIIVSFLIRQLRLLCDQLLNNIGKIPGQSLAHF